jgi:hypothetical protein
MEDVTKFITFVIANIETIVAAVVGLVNAIILIAMLVPGAEPEKTLQKIVDFIGKFSAKKKID